MQYQALYRKYRPKTFDEIVGQKHVSKTLKNEIKANRISHAYLFCGGRGTGKTSTARIFSRAINCLNNKDGNPCNECENCRGILDGTILDVIEIDAASNNGVDNIRDLREEARYTTSVASQKVYIIDEVHMLSTGAFNALLKLLEEPPSHVRFILATTEVHKVPKTIQSRCQRFDFKRISPQDIAGQLRFICENENIKFDEKALSLIAHAADGAMRDAIGILEQCLSINENCLSYKDVSEFLGAADNDILESYVLAISEGDAPKVLSIIDNYVNEGKSVLRFCEGVVSYFRNLLVAKLTPNPHTALDVTEEEGKRLKETADLFTHEKLLYGVDLFLEGINTLKFLESSKTLLEVLSIKLLRPNLSNDIESLQVRIAELEQKIMRANFKPESPKDVISEEKTKEEKKETKKTQKEETPRQQKPQGGGLAKEVKSALKDIIKILHERNHSTIMMALSNADFCDDDGKLGIVFPPELADTFMPMIKEGKEVLEGVIGEVIGKDTTISLKRENEGIKKEDKLNELLNSDIIKIED